MTFSHQVQVTSYQCVNMYSGYNKSLNVSVHESYIILPINM